MGRKLAIDTARLWTFLVFQAGLTKAADTSQMKILKWFLIRSKEAFIDLTIVLDGVPQWCDVPRKTRHAIEKRHLKLASLLRSTLGEHSHRCRSFMLVASNTVMAGVFFPLPARMPALANFGVRTDPKCGHSGHILSLVPEGIECQLGTMTISTYRMPQVEHIDFLQNSHPHFGNKILRGSWRGSLANVVPVS